MTDPARQQGRFNRVAGRARRWPKRVKRGEAEIEEVVETSKPAYRKLPLGNPINGRAPRVFRGVSLVRAFRCCSYSYTPCTGQGAFTLLKSSLDFPRATISRAWPAILGSSRPTVSDRFELVLIRS